MEEYFSIQARMTEAVDMTFIRSVYEKIQWNSRLIGILGARGTGKSTLVMQNPFGPVRQQLPRSRDSKLFPDF